MVTQQLSLIQQTAKMNTGCEVPQNVTSEGRAGENPSGGPLLKQTCSCV